MRDAAAFLMEPAREGYPADYLLARLASRRGELVVRARAAGGAAGAATPLQARAGMRREFRWVYLRMERRLREQWAPLFLWFELGTILVCLRHLRAADREQVARNLADSLLGERIRAVFTSGEPVFAPAGPLAELAGADLKQARELERWYREAKGLEYERRLASLCLERLSREPLPAPLREFLALAADMRNLVAVAKQLRWGVAEQTALVPGGNLPGERLAKVLKQRDQGAFLKLLPRFTAPAPPEAAPDRLEHALLVQLTRRVRRQAADRLGDGFILAYLWEVYLEARNTAVAHHGEALGADVLANELIP